MNKNDLISAVADSSGLSKSDASSAVEGVFDSGTPALGQNGTYSAFMYTARMGNSVGVTDRSSRGLGGRHMR